MDLDSAKYKLKNAIFDDLRKRERVQKVIDCVKYEKTYEYINKYDYFGNDIIQTKVREKIPHNHHEIMAYPSSYNERYAAHEVLYQLLCAELLFVIYAIERVDPTSFSYTYYRTVNYGERAKVLKKCWEITKSLYDCYYESADKFKDVPSYDIISSTQMSSTFNSICLELKNYFESRKDVDTRSTGQKVVDTAQSTVESIMLHVIGFICMVTVLLLMAKCCGAEVHPFG